MSGAILLCTDDFWDECGERLVAIDPSSEVVRLVRDEHITPGDLDRVTVAHFSSDVWRKRVSQLFGSVRRSPNLEWFHTSAAGTDHPIYSELRERGVVVTSSAGAAAPSIAHTVMLYLIGLSRHLPAVIRDQAKKVWEPRDSIDLDGLRLGIVGLGSIGTEVALLAKAFGMEVIGLRRSVRGDEPCTTWSTDRLDELLAWSNAVCVTAPLTDETRGLFGHDRFQAMRPGAWFVNVGRGEIVDEVALDQHLTSGHLAGAGLDVFAVEPLPADSPLWTHANVIITPHSSGDTRQTARRATEIFIDNFERFTAGKSMRNVT